MSDDIFYYKFDKCYNHKLDNDTSLNSYIDTNFDDTLVSDAKTCENLALEKNTEFFLLTDLNNITHKIKCLIPKVNISKNAQDLLSPFSSILNTLFGDESTRGGSVITDIETSNNLVISNSSNCLNYLLDNKIYAPKDKFALYKSGTLNDNVIGKLQNIKSYDYYKNKLDDLNNYDELLKSGFDGGILALAFKNFICDDNKSYYEIILDRRIDELKNTYSNLFSNLDSINRDLSDINILTKSDNIYLENIQKKIDFQKKQLSNLLGLGGANNGKLSDTKYLKNVEMSEVTILFLVIVIVIFIYSKKK
tara:strand:+ start:702 stop:1622 length:921 start_codon:yes stop_codon:yes gene_type:complete